MIEIRNFCHEHKDRVEKMRTWTKVVIGALGLNDKSGVILFRDYEVAFDGEYRGGENVWGLEGSFTHIHVCKADMMPDDALKWMIAHELRHAFQSHFNVEFDEPEPASYASYLSDHNYRAEEIDADKYADLVTSYDGNKWWRDVVEPWNAAIRKQESDAVRPS